MKVGAAVNPGRCHVGFVRGLLQQLGHEQGGQHRAAALSLVCRYAFSRVPYTPLRVFFSIRHELLRIYPLRSHTGGARTRSSARRAADTADAHQVRPGGMPRSMHAASCRRLASFTAPCPPAPHATLLPRGSLCHGLYHPAGVLWEGSRAHAAFRQSFVHLEPASGGHLAGHARACGARKGARRGKKEKRECGGAG